MHLWHAVFGGSPHDLTTWQMLARAVVAYAVGLALVRVFREMRLLGKYAPFDTVLAIMLGSTLSRAINGTPLFGETLVASLGLVLVHTALGTAAYHSQLVGDAIKGRKQALLEGGAIQRDGLKRVRLTEADLEEALRLKVPVTDRASVDAVYLERNGGVGVVSRPAKPHVIEVAVEAGVKIVRIELR